MRPLGLLLYYTDVAGIPAVAVGTLFLLVRVWDAASDVLAGRIVDATMTQVPEERAKLASFRVVGANATGLMLALVVAPQISGSSNLQQSLTLTTLALVVVGMALYLFTFLTAREQVQRDVAKVSMRQSFATLRHNQPLLMLCASSLMFLTGWFSLQTVGAFYARNVLGDANLYIPITLLQNVGTFVAAALVPRLVERIGKKVTYMAGGAIAIVSGIGLIAAPGSVPALAIAIFGVLGFGLGAVNTLMWAIEADTVDYGEWKTGCAPKASLTPCSRSRARWARRSAGPRPPAPSASTPAWTSARASPATYALARDRVSASQTGSSSAVARKGAAGVTTSTRTIREPMVPAKA